MKTIAYLTATPVGDNYVRSALHRAMDPTRHEITEVTSAFRSGMAEFDLQAFETLIAAVDAAATSHEKGARFEDLGHYVMNTLDGTEVVERDVDTSTTCVRSRGRVEVG